MRLHTLKPPTGSKKPRKRVGRGTSSGQGSTSGRGSKGQKARSGAKIRVGFEGGQMPLARRLPKLGGFTPRNRVVFAEVNVSKLERFDAGETIDPLRLAEEGLIKKADARVKILGNGELSKGLTVKAHAYSKTAREKIETAGGKAEVI
ncbi:MAG: 50S ribosomal protein L15 [Actinobacteria bacterium]|nr:50S ribosomal protein L15 [Actinomycetota bacterium]